MELLLSFLFVYSFCSFSFPYILPIRLIYCYAIVICCHCYSCLFFLRCASRLSEDDNDPQAVSGKIISLGNSVEQTRKNFESAKQPVVVDDLRAAGKWGMKAGAKDLRSATASPASTVALGSPRGVGGSDIPPGWTEHLDPGTQRHYYYHHPTKQSQWFKPPMSAEDEGSESGWGSRRGSLKGSLKGSGKGGGSVGDEEAMPPGWVESTDPTSGRDFFFHKESGERSLVLLIPPSRPIPSSSSSSHCRFEYLSNLF